MDIVPSVINGLIAAVAVAFVMYITRQQYRDLKEGYETSRKARRTFARNSQAFDPI